MSGDYFVLVLVLICLVCRNCLYGIANCIYVIINVLNDK